MGATIVKYSDSSQTRNLDQVGEFTIDGSLGTADGDNFLERGEVFEVSIPTATMTALSPRLGTNDTFTLEVIPPRGAVLFIQRTVPASIEERTSLD